MNSKLYFLKQKLTLSSFKYINPRFQFIPLIQIYKIKFEACRIPKPFYRMSVVWYSKKIFTAESKYDEKIRC